MLHTVSQIGIAPWLITIIISVFPFIKILFSITYDALLLCRRILILITTWVWYTVWFIWHTWVFRKSYRFWFLFLAAAKTMAAKIFIRGRWRWFFRCLCQLNWSRFSIFAWSLCMTRLPIISFSFFQYSMRFLQKLHWRDFSQRLRRWYKVSTTGWFLIVWICVFFMHWSHVLRLFLMRTLRQLFTSLRRWILPK